MLPALLALLLFAAATPARADAPPLTVLVAGQDRVVSVQAGDAGAALQPVEGGRGITLPAVAPGTPLTLRQGDGRVLWTGETPAGDEARTVGFLPGRGGRLQRVPLAPGQGETAVRAVPWGRVGLATGWLALVVGLVAATRRSGRAVAWRWWQTPVLFALLAAVWSWPAALLAADSLAVRHYDLFPVLWLLERLPLMEGVPGLDPLRHAASAWPHGETVGRLDSWLLLPLAWLPVPPVVIAGLLGWLGPALSAWAAEVCARRAFGVPAPWSLAAGLAYGFSGMAASAALEGHVSHLPEPWLPLCLGAAWRAGSADGRWPHGLLAGVGAALALLTTGYHGLDAALILGVLGLRAAANGRLPALLPALLPLGLAAAFVAWNGLAGSAEPFARTIATRGSASVLSLWAWTPGVDTFDHSVSAPLSGLLLAGILLARGPGSGWLRALCGLSLLLALGPTLRLLPWQAGLALPWAPLWDTVLGTVLRFPVRFTWVLALAGGLLAAHALQGRPAWLLGLLLLDPFLATGMPARQGTQALPQVQPLREGPVLDLFPLAIGLGPSDIDMQARTRACAAQLSHGQPVLARCMGTAGGDDRERVAGTVLPVLMGGAGPSVEGLLRREGVATVVLHADWFRAEDLAVLEPALFEALGPPDPQGPRLIYEVSPR